MPIVFSIYHFLTGPKNSKNLKCWANDEPAFFDWPILQYQDIAKNLANVQFSQILKNLSDISEHVQRSD